MTTSSVFGNRLADCLLQQSMHCWLSAADGMVCGVSPLRVEKFSFVEDTSPAAQCDQYGRQM